LTPYEQKFLDHCIAMAKVDKKYSWFAAKNFAALDPQLSDLPSNLATAMNALKDSNPLETSTKTGATSQRLLALRQQSRS